MKNIIFIVGASLLLTACGSLKMTPEEKAARIRQVEENIATNNYILQVDKMKPMRGRIISLTPDYSLTIRNDSAISHLPFFGRATYVPYGGDGGIKFAEKMDNYQITTTSKGDGWEARFDVRTPDYSYKFHLTIYQEGACSISVYSSQRDAIGFWGEMR